jgi:hypothetical protein
MVDIWQRLCLNEIMWMFRPSCNKEWKLLRTTDISTDKNDDSFLVYFNASENSSV